MESLPVKSLTQLDATKSGFILSLSAENRGLLRTGSGEDFKRLILRQSPRKSLRAIEDHRARCGI